MIPSSSTNRRGRNSDDRSVKGTVGGSSTSSSGSTVKLKIKKPNASSSSEISNSSVLVNMDDLLKKLNEEQRKAVCSNKDQVIVMAGPGTGKTSVITYRIFYLVHKLKINPKNICALTFSRQAAKEMKHRSMALDDNLKNVTFSTFHAKGLSLLKQYKLVRKFKIADERTIMSIISRILDGLEISEQCSPAEMKDALAFVKNAGITPETVSKLTTKDISVPLSFFKPFYKEYEETLDREEILTHEDLIFKVVKALKQNQSILKDASQKVQYLLVDEYQDTNDLQYEFTKLLIQHHKKIFCVGDSKQAIFGWRFSNVQNFVNLSSDFPNAETIILKQNYRSTSNILDASFDMLLNSKDEKATGDKKDIKSIILDDSKSRLLSQKGNGATVTLKEFLTHTEQLQYVVETIKNHVEKNGGKYGDFAILARVNNLLRPYEAEFEKHKIPCDSNKSGFTNSAWVQVMLSYLETIDSISRNSVNGTALRKIVNIPDRRIFSETGSAIVDCLTNGIKLADLITMIEKKQRIMNFKIGKQISFLISMDREEHSSVLGMLRQFQEMSNLINGNTGCVKKVIKYITEYIGLEDYMRENYKPFEKCWKDIEELLSMSEKSDNLQTYLQEVNMIEEGSRTGNGVALMTMHSSKGLEFEHVFLTDLIDGVSPHYKSKGSSREEDEEKRLLFVAMTRARTKMYLMTTKTKQSNEMIELVEPTPWLKTLRFKSYVEYQPIPRKLDRDIEEAADLAIFLKKHLESLAPVPIKLSKPVNSKKEKKEEEFILEDIDISPTNNQKSSSTAPLFMSATSYLESDMYDNEEFKLESDDDEDIKPVVSSKPTSITTDMRDSQISVADDEVFELEDDSDDEIDIDLDNIVDSQVIRNVDSQKFDSQQIEIFDDEFQFIDDDEENSFESDTKKRKL